MIQSNQQANARNRNDDDDDDRGGFFLFPFFRGKRIEAFPFLLILGLFLYWGLYVWQAPVTPTTDVAPPQQAAAPTMDAAPPQQAAAPTMDATPPQDAAATAKDPALPPEMVAAAAPEPVKVETQRWGSSIIFPIDGKDGAGKHAAFDVAVMPKELSWMSKSATQLALGGEAIPDDQLSERLFTPELKDGLAKSTQVLAIGLASQEGQVEEETERAGNRARTAAGWLATAVAPETGIWLLNLGQFKKNGCPAQTETTDTSWQRPVILVGVKSLDDGTDLTQAFADAISGKSNLPSRECYTSFELSRFR